jgi:16S rRNA A1518/A1519 N6-dimethyltransferase RsmA/KsgA/DIM1 with predicted DNA glycosylase/AP lyase activity
VPELPLPPKRLRVTVGPFANGKLFRTSGVRMVEEIAEPCDLAPDHHVLEIGCGCGDLSKSFRRRLIFYGVRADARFAPLLAVAGGAEENNSRICAASIWQNPSA